MSTPKPLLISDVISREKAERMLGLLRDARLPKENILPSASWDYGMDLLQLDEMRRYWAEDWTWEELESDLNAFKHYTVEIEGIDLHYIHAPSSRADAIPIIMTHGWPGSVYELLKVIEPLRNPPSIGDSAFHVVVPSLPGYGFSGPPPRKKWTLVDTARVFNYLMTTVLGYPEYVAQGGDWGFIVTRALSVYHSSCTLAHFSNFLAPPPKVQLPFLALLSFIPESMSSYLSSYFMSPLEFFALQRGMGFRDSGLGYYHLNSTKPATIGYALYDNPIGLLAYIGEKYHEWTDPINPLPIKDVVNSVALYYLTGTFHTSTLPYYESTRIHIPKQTSGETGISLFKWDVLFAPKSWASKIANVTFYKEHMTGGHFAGLESPEILVADVREFVVAQWKN